MGLVKIRSYPQEVFDRLFNLAKTTKNFSIEFIGRIDHMFADYLLFCVTVGGNQNVGSKRDVLISAGVHGEEPAGVYSLLKFLEEDLPDFTDDFRFLIFPCINPFGFERGCRFNFNRLDINREFKKNTSSYEAKRVMDVLRRKGRKYSFTIDLHETDPNFAGEGFVQEDNPREFYMWEVCPNKSIRIGAKVIEDLERVSPVCRWDRVYGDINNGGVIWYPEGCENEVYAQRTTLEGFLADNYTPQAFTLETPCGWDINRRVFIHRVALRTILDLKRNA